MKNMRKASAMKSVHLVLVVVLSIMAWEAWQAVPQADAQNRLLPNAAEQRAEMIKAMKSNHEELKQIKAELSQLRGMLEAGEVKVKVSGSR